MLSTRIAWAEETCRYSGDGSYSSRIVVETRATTRNGETTVDATAAVSARAFGLIDWQYLYQEIGTWRDGELRSVAVNHRYSLAGRIRRQQWDMFNRTPDGMSAWRVQGKTLDDFQARHPGFVRHWEPATFGAPWRDDYAQSSPERRADLDLPRAEMTSGLGTPLLLGFYWIRFAGDAGRTVPVFLPGFKRDARVDVNVASVGVDPGGLLHLRSSLRHPQLSASEPSIGDAWVAADHRLLRVTFDGHGKHGAAHGELRLEGCQGIP